MALSLTVAALAFSALLLELLLARIFPVVLGDFSSFLAIPATMLGLGLGAAVLHLQPFRPQRTWLRWMLPLLFVVDLGCLSAEFTLVDSVFGLTHRMSQNPLEDARKIAALTTLMIPPFALIGACLGVAFRSAPREVGRLYAFDLGASALACLAAPSLLQLVDLPVVCAVQVAGLGLGCVAALDGRTRWAAAALLAPLCGWLITEADQQRLFDVHPDPAVLGLRLTDEDGVQFEELAHRWNDISRVTLLRGDLPGGLERTWIVHDDGVSRVNVEPWEPGGRRPGRRHNTRALHSLMDHAPRSALVIFAGAGRDMLELRALNDGPLSTTGIELNGLVTELVTADPDDPYRLSAFLAQPDVQLLAEEGRSFLDRARGTYDLIYVANNGAQQMGRTGHSRRFLDTEGAMASYLDHLAPGGVVVFSRQQVEQKVEAFKRLLAARGVDPSQALAVFGRRRPSSLLVKPSGLTPDEVVRLEKSWSDRRDDWLLYAPGAPEPDPGTLRLATTPPRPEAHVPTDDRPYERPIRYGRFQLLPAPEAMKDLRFAMEWTKLFTVCLYTGLTALLLLLVQAVPKRGAHRRVPGSLFAWFLTTGIAYMAVQIGLMAKLELLLGRPLVSIAVVLAGFLLFNAAGAAWVGRRPETWRPTALPLAAVLGVLVALGGSELLVRFGLALPLALKAGLALCVLAPVATALGTLYPAGVRETVAAGATDQVPATFALTACSSVLGSTWAMVAVLNLGFRAVVLCAIPLYLLAAVALRARRVPR